MGQQDFVFVVPSLFLFFVFSVFEFSGGEIKQFRHLEEEEEAAAAPGGLGAAQDMRDISQTAVGKWVNASSELSCDLERGRQSST